MMAIEVEEVGEDRVVWHLDNWEAWMRKGKVGRWYPSRASGRMGVSSSSDFDTLVANVDAHCAAAVDALIDDMPLHDRLAIYHVHLAAVFRFSGDITAVYAGAKQRLIRGLAARGIW